jgi:hypothetical protein
MEYPLIIVFPWRIGALPSWIATTEPSNSPLYFSMVIEISQTFLGWKLP